MESIRRYCTHFKHRLFGAPASIPGNAPRARQHPPSTLRDPLPTHAHEHRVTKIGADTRRARAVSKKSGIKECVRCLQSIVYSLDHFEAAEELRSAVRCRVRDLLPYEADVEIKTSGSSIARDRLTEGVEKAFQSLQARIGELLPYSNGDSRIKLPEYLSSQLTAYTSAKKDLESLKSAEVQSILERLNPGPDDVRHPGLGRAWTPNGPLYANKEGLEELSEKQQSAIDEAKRDLVAISRKLCKEQVRKALRDDAILDQERQSSGTKLVQTEDLMGKDGVIGPPMVQPPQKPAKVPREIDPVALKEWNEVRQSLKKWQANFNAMFNPLAEDKIVRQGAPNGTVEERQASYEKLFRYRRKAANILKDEEAKYIEVQTRAMKAGLQPQVDTLEKAAAESIYRKACELATSLGAFGTIDPNSTFLRAFEEVMIPGMRTQTLPGIESEAEAERKITIRDALEKCVLLQEDHEVELAVFSEHASDGTEKSGARFTSEHGPEVFAVWNSYIGKAFLNKVEDHDPYENIPPPVKEECALWDTVSVDFGDSRSCELSLGPTMARRDKIRKYREQCAKWRLQAEQTHAIRKHTAGGVLSLEKSRYLPVRVTS
ncbi:hypothetical protein HII31_04718 [Pseudocercospora fuligena]|uniref:Uncharacterized protein n=1 Tax=Pseudocercospora fuligena TaxID=685502 RepID=A0A8H6VJH2_9PEZI|nr:hypothetical protein HII31_04718 [Pseudocercospora fuligena]